MKNCGITFEVVSNFILLQKKVLIQAQCYHYRTVKSDMDIIFFFSRPILFTIAKWSLFSLKLQFFLYMEKRKFQQSQNFIYSFRHLLTLSVTNGFDLWDYLIILVLRGPYKYE